MVFVKKLRVCRCPLSSAGITCQQCGCLNGPSSSASIEMDAVAGCTTSSSTSSDATDAQRTAPEAVCEKSKREAKKDSRKRQRTTFSQTQLQILEDAFARQQYLVGSERVRLAVLLNIGVPQVKVWFQNRRIRWRREQREMLMAQVRSQSYQVTSSSGMNPSEESLMSKQFTNQQKLPSIDEQNI